MELWYSEFHTGNVKLSVRINRQLFSGESEFQRIDVFESEEFGRFVALDGEIVFSDKDEFIYDEMVTHVPMTVHPNVKNVLIIGGGDGGVARELIHYPQIESIDVVESDKMFVDVCAEMFPDIAQGLKDERVNIYYEDGLRFLRNKKARYDLKVKEKLEELRELCDVMLVEADGAKHHPVKVPEKWEPVIPRCADIVISVIGLDCLGQPISQSAYRMERTSEFLRKSLEAPITEEDIVKIATSICGLFKDVEERVYRVYLNKSDILREKEPAEHIVEELERKNTVAAYGSLLEE